ncbi:cytochrome o ubiquinol oxidase subunit IV [Bradyrhizobium sp. GM5.1]
MNTDTHAAHADDHHHGDSHANAHGSFSTYMLGFVLSVVLTAIPFWLVMSGALPSKQITALVIMAFAVVQIVVHMIYFLHMNTTSENGWSMMALIFTIVMVVIALSGSLWVMNHLNSNMMPIHPDDRDEMNETRTVTSEANGTRSNAARPPLWLTILSLTAIALLIALGVWQIERRAWKLALIDRVEQRVHAPAQPIPSPAAWPTVSAANDEYRHVSVSGRFLHDRETLAQAVTEEGPGYWVLTPLRRDDGTLVLVNRGFVPSDRRDASTRWDGNPQGQVEITGLLRVTEPQKADSSETTCRSTIAGTRGMSQRLRRHAASTTSRPFSSMPTLDHNPAAAQSAD